MTPVKFRATIDEETVKAIPVLRPFLGRRILLIVQDASPKRGREATVSVDELLEARIQLPPDIGSLTSEDIERAIVKGALGR